MKCLDCGTEMEQGTVEGYAQGGSHSYEFTADTEKKENRHKRIFFQKNCYCFAISRRTTCMALSAL